MADLLEELEYTVECEGFVLGTPAFDKRLREMKVERCREMKRFAVCSECPVYDECGIRRAALKDQS